jgi:DNA-binding GntR family transcriptional regulator
VRESGVRESGAAADGAAYELGRVSTVEALAAELRRRILTGGITPGEQLREVQLADAFGVGRHSLRAAMQNLVHEGLLRHAPNRGHFVPQLTETDVTDLFLVRSVLESEAAAIAASRGQQAASPAASALARLEAIAADHPWDEVIDADLAFHRALVDQVGSPRLSHAFAALHAELQLLNAQVERAFPDRAELGSQHRAVLDAVSSGDPEAARAAVRQHMTEGIAQFKIASGAAPGSGPATASGDQPWHDTSGRQHVAPTPRRRRRPGGG